MCDELNLSWLDEDERLSKIQQNYIRENMSSIQCYNVYINMKMHIDKIVCSVKELTIIDSSSCNMGFTNEILLQHIESNKQISTGIKYKLLDILLYNIELEPENIQHYSQSDTLFSNSLFLKSYLAIQSIPVPPSIFIFHNLNSIYFLFQEVESVKSAKSILSHDSKSTNSKHKTRKVTIQDCSKPDCKRNNFTKRY